MLMVLEGQSQPLKNVNSFVQKSISNKEAKNFNQHTAHNNILSQFVWKSQNENLDLDFDEGHNLEKIEI